MLIELSPECVAALAELVRAGIGSDPAAVVAELIRREKVRLTLRRWEATLHAEWSDAVCDSEDIEASFRKKKSS